MIWQLAEGVVPASDPTMQYGALGIVATIVGWFLIYAGPKIVAAVEKIGPGLQETLKESMTKIGDEMKRQEDKHAADRKDTEARHAAERAAYLNTISDAARATRDALEERTG